MIRRGLLISASLLMMFHTGASSQAIEKNRHRSVALTFDDLPSTHGNAPYVINLLTRKLIDQSVPAIGFVNESKVYTNGAPDDTKIALLKQWVDANLDLGNHSFSHIAIDEVPLSSYKADVLKGEKITKQLLLEKGKKLSYYRHTQLRTGPTAELKEELEEFLNSNDYSVAPVTIDNNDYIFANLYEKRESGMTLQ